MQRQQRSNQPAGPDGLGAEIADGRRLRSSGQQSGRADQPSFFKNSASSRRFRALGRAQPAASTRAQRLHQLVDRRRCVLAPFDAGAPFLLLRVT